jgi:VIT1/CCC1 family predicted Fe2+/Mn2+ transporter
METSSNVEMLSESVLVDYIKQFMKDEIKISIFYHRLSKVYAHTPLSNKLSRFHEMERDHAVFWANFLKKRDIQVEDLNNISLNRYKFSFTILVYRLLGIGLAIKMLELLERDLISRLLVLRESPLISAEDKQGITSLIEEELRHEEEFEEYESQYKFFIKKVNVIFYHLSYGLIAVLSVSAGLAGVYTNAFNIGLIGLIVGLSDVISTMLGRYISDKTENQVKRSILERITLACKSAPNFFFDKIFKYMKQKDFSEDVAKEIAHDATSKTNLMNRLVVEEEYGFKIDDIGNPFKASIYSGLFRLVGTILPLSPYFFGIPVSVSMILSVFVGILMFIITGFILALSTNMDIKKKITELIVNGLVLTALVFVLGKLTSQIMTFIK